MITALLLLAIVNAIRQFAFWRNDQMIKSETPQTK